MGLQGLKFISHVHFEQTVYPTGSFTIGQIRAGDMDPRKVTKQVFTQATTAKVRRDKGWLVASFSDLVHCVAQLGSHNSRFNLFFRGQNEDYLDKKNQTKLYPSIFRPDKGQKRLHNNVVRARFKKLQDSMKSLRANSHDLGLLFSPLSIHNEYWLSLLQHYGICFTPLLDLTQSLRVAASFALLNLETRRFQESGYLYVLGMPHLHGCISFFADDGMTIVKLQSVCPPQALRPHFQEGYLVGRWPRTGAKQATDNFAYWLVGKYQLDNTSADFFGGDFPPIPADALIPRDDEFRDKLITLFNDMG